MTTEPTLSETLHTVAQLQGKVGQASERELLDLYAEARTAEAMHDELRARHRTDINNAIRVLGNLLEAADEHFEGEAGCMVPQREAAREWLRIKD